MKRNLLVVVVVVAVLAAMVWAGLVNYRRRAAEQARAKQIQAVLSQSSTQGSDSPDAIQTNPLANKQAPEFKLSDTNGKKVSLSSYKGKAVVIDFWATWCGPCKVEIPWLVKLRQQYAGQGLEILGVSEDELDLDDPAALLKEKREIAEGAAKLGIDYPVLYDDSNVAKPYGGIDNLPTTFYVDRTGKVVGSTIGLVDRDEIEANIKKALAGSDTSKGQS